MKQLIIFSLEPIESRYTKEWYTHLPKLFKEKLEDFEIIQIDGDTKSSRPTPGAFLDFEATNMWKSEQVIKFFDKMSKGLIQDDAYILLTDFWNPCIFQLKYTKDLCKKNWTLLGIAHAGSYDPNDFLGRIRDKNWSLNVECGFYWAYDKIWFATDFHIRLFCSEVGGLGKKDRFIRSGFPMEYIPETFDNNIEKEDLIVFPARIAPEKQPEIFETLEKMLPEYKFVMCCKENMNKSQYHDTMKRAKLMLSFSLQETYGITVIEALYAKCLALVPDRLSYREMYNKFDSILYPSEWSLPENINYEKLVERIKYTMNNYKNIMEQDINKNLSSLYNDYVQSDIFIKKVFNP